MAGTTFTSGNPTTLGSNAGAYSRIIPTAALPAHAHNVYLADPGHTHTTNASVVGTGTGIVTIGGYPFGNATINPATTGIKISDGAGNLNQVTSVGGGATMDMTPAMLLFTVYIKL